MQRTFVIHRVGYFLKFNYVRREIKQGPYACCNVNVDLTGANVEGATFNFSGRSSYRPDAPPERITLTNLLQKPGWGTLIGAALGALLVYGCNAIIYFTNLILTSNDPILAGFYQFLIVQNIVNGAVAFLLTWALSGWLTRRFQTTWKQHVFLSWATVISFFAINSSIYLWLGKGFIDALMKRPNFETESAPWFVYVLGDILIANVFLYVLQQGRPMSESDW